MRILLITDNHSRSGGAEHYFFDLKQRLKQVPGLDVYSIGFGPTAMQGEDFFVLKGVRSKAARLFWQIFFHPIIYFKLRQQLKKIKPDIIHLHNVKQYTPSLLHAIKPYPVVQTIHDYGAVCPIAHNLHKDHQPCPTGLRRQCFWQHQVKYPLFIYLALTIAFFKLRKQLKKSVKKFFAPSPLLVDYLKKNQFHDANYIAPFKNENNAYAFDKINPYHFFFAGNLGTHKGIYTLVDEFAHALQQNNQLTLTIAGTGQEEARLRQRITALGLEKNIFISGWQNNLDQAYETCAAVIFPSLWMEAFGLVITEAMSHARPVIGSNRGSPVWLIDDQQTGLIFDPLKKGDLADKILTIAGHIGLVKKLGENGYNKLQKFSKNEDVLREIIGLYKECLRT